MKLLIISLLVIINILNLKGQKPTIDSASYMEWPTVGDVSISNNGKFSLYSTFNRINHERERLFIRSNKSEWKVESSTVKNAAKFTQDSKYVAFLEENGDLNIINLERKTSQIISNVIDFSIPDNGNGKWIFYNVNKPKHAVLKNLSSGNEKTFNGESFATFSNDGKTLILQRFIGDHSGCTNLEWVDLITEKTFLIYTGPSINDIAYDFPHNQIAFKTSGSVWYFKKGMNYAKILNISEANTKDSGLVIGSIQRFSNDGTHLFLKLEDIEQVRPKPAENGVIVWSYLDKTLQSKQDFELKKVRKATYLATIRISDCRVFKFQKFKNEIFTGESLNDFFISYRRVDDGSPEEWRAGSEWSCDLVNARTSERKNMDFLTNKRMITIQIGPSSKYLVYFNQKERNYFSYNRSSGEILNLTKNIHTKWWDTNVNDFPNGPEIRGIAAWISEDEKVLIYDSHDLWKLDLENKVSPVNLTNAYGAKNNIVFSLTFGLDENKSISKYTNLMLTAFNLDTKENGFFTKGILKSGDPHKLTMGPYLYNLNNPYVNSEVGTEFPPIKAKYASEWIVRRMNAKEAPNYFITSDFKGYKPLSNINPQIKYNWFTTELHQWASLNGKILQGILYKPENFDPSKKYPVIFYYYERKSASLNEFLYPRIISGEIDIPTYVSNGYLVFSPDIYYQVGNPMQGTYDAVISAANYVGKFPYVDIKRLGLRGQSFGGLQTNYIVTHTNIFAAACSSAGIGNCTSLYGNITREGDAQADFFENSQPRLGSMLWENMSGYLNSSAVFYAYKVTTPLLLMHGMKDGICLFPNILEFYTGLRRLGKRAWLLSYPEGDHTLDIRDAEDFTKRLRQFYDHYLKGEPAPIWMTRGIAASRRGLETGFEYDRQINTPGVGLLKPEELAKVDSLMKINTINISLK